MSYCRWSSMNTMCDVYTYEDVSGGWTTHVARRRRIFPPIPNTWMGPTWWVMLTLRLHMWSLALIPSKNIGLPHDGESFNNDTPGECAELLEYLRNLGYKVPQYAIDNLKEEQKELDDNARSSSSPK